MADARFRLCLVTDSNLIPRGALVETVLTAVRGGVTMVQLREKTASGDDVAAQVEMLLRVLRPLGIPLLVNDRVEVAWSSGADGVHLGQEDLPPTFARARLGRHALIGLSITDPRQLASADVLAADYLGVGPYFETATKPGHDPLLGLERSSLTRRCRASRSAASTRSAHLPSSPPAWPASPSSPRSAVSPTRSRPPVGSLAFSSDLEVLS